MAKGSTIFPFSWMKQQIDKLKERTARNEENVSELQARGDSVYMASVFTAGQSTSSTTTEKVAEKVVSLEAGTYLLSMTASVKVSGNLGWLVACLGDTQLASLQTSETTPYYQSITIPVVLNNDYINSTLWIGMKVHNSSFTISIPYASNYCLSLTRIK